MITTIQLHENVKKSLDKLKENKKESYEEVILGMINKIEKQKRQEEQLLKEGYLEMAEDSLKISEDFKHIDSKLGWEWKDED